MDFGVFCAAPVGPPPWEKSEPERFHQDLEMGIPAEAAGFDSFWAPEHHFLEEYSHNSASHLTCLAVGMRTERIRLVTGIMNPDTVELAGRMGLGVAVFSFQSARALEPPVERYKKAIADPEPVGEVVNDRFLTVAPLLCLEDGDEAGSAS